MILGGWGVGRESEREARDCGTVWMYGGWGGGVRVWVRGGEG